MDPLQIKLELLSPAYNILYGKAAINHGADAVYIGASKFGARANANNPIKEIEELIKYAHLFKAKVYVTLNTILFDNEIHEAVKLIKELYNAGVDGIIIQDLGLLELDLPPVPLIASTQTHNAGIDKVLMLQSLGFKRVILARELSLKEIKEIRANSSVELEFFIHGALCVSYSGQCYMSETICNRSGNRGICAQPCRSVYDLIDNKGKVLVKNKYLLSLQDLNLSGYLSELIDAGITSFKIEGRLKDIAYVKNITSYYRQKIDSLIEGNKGYRKSSSGKIYFDFTPDPEKSFNRGFTSYFIKGRTEKPGSPDTQKSLGKRIGYVTSVNNNLITTDCDDITNGDGLCYFSNDNVLCGASVQKVEGRKVFMKDRLRVSIGAELYRNHDQKFEKMLSGNSAIRKIGIKVLLEEKTEGLSLKVIDEDGFVSKKLIDIKREIAHKPEQALKNIADQLNRLGDTIFEATEIRTDLSKVYFLPVSVINKARRDVIDNLESLRIQNYKFEKGNINRKPDKFFSENLNYLFNVSNIYSRNLYKKLGAEVIEPAFELQTERFNTQVMITKYCIKYQFDACPKYQKKKNLWEVPLFLKDNNHIYRLEFDCKNCMMKVIFEK